MSIPRLNKHKQQRALVLHLRNQTWPTYSATQSHRLWAMYYKAFWLIVKLILSIHASLWLIMYLSNIRSIITLYNTRLWCDYYFYVRSNHDRKKLEKSTVDVFNSLAQHLLIYLCKVCIANTVKPVHSDCPRETQKVVFVDRFFKYMFQWETIFKGNKKCGPCIIFHEMAHQWI